MGSTHEIHDDATGQIMESFWRHTAAGAEPARALRAAKLDYLQTVPQHRDQPVYWAPLITYGTTTN